MKMSNLSVNRAIRSRRSSNPKLILGKESAIEGASAVSNEARIALADKDGSNIVAMMICEIELVVGAIDTLKVSDRNLDWMRRR